MTEEETTLGEVTAFIQSQPPEIEEAINELAEHIERQLICAGEPVGSLALVLVGARRAAA